MTELTHSAQMKQDRPAIYRWENPEHLDCEGVEFMEFRLTYEGYLSASGTTKEKHKLRRHFHPQLRRLWKEHPCLEHKWEEFPLVRPPADRMIREMQRRGYMKEMPWGKSTVDVLGEQFNRCGYQFVPIVNTRFDLTCALNILFLRRGSPGDLILPGGDVDNRIKILLDALKTPLECNQVDGPPSEGEVPFFTLLQDDSLITDLHITTDRLLTVPVESGRDSHQVMLVIHVVLKATKSTLENLQMIS